MPGHSEDVALVDKTVFCRGVEVAIGNDMTELVGQRLKASLDDPIGIAKEQWGCAVQGGRHGLNLFSQPPSWIHEKRSWITRKTKAGETKWVKRSAAGMNDASSRVIHSLAYLNRHFNFAENLS